jgi:hypothetical protein
LKINMLCCFFAIIFIAGCASNQDIEQKKAFDFVSRTDKTCDISSPILGHVHATGNAQVAIAPPENLPRNLLEILTSSSAAGDDSFEKSIQSGWFYILAGIGILLAMLSLVIFERSKTGKAVQSLAESLKDRIMDATPGSADHKALQAQLRDLERRIK